MYALRVKEYNDLAKALAGNAAELARVGTQLSQVCERSFDDLVNSTMRAPLLLFY